MGGQGQRKTVKKSPVSSWGGGVMLDLGYQRRGLCKLSALTFHRVTYLGGGGSGVEGGKALNI